MRVLVVPDRVPRDAADAVVAGWRSSAPHDVAPVLVVPDGGPGWADALRGAEGVHVELPPAAGATVTDEGSSDDGSSDDGARAVAADAEVLLGGLAAARARRLADPDGGPGRLPVLTVALGAPGVPDAGLGLLRGLASAILGPGSRDEVSAATWLPALARAVADVGLVAVAPTTTPLLGLRGTAATLAADGTLGPAAAQALEERLSRRAHGLVAALPDALLPGGARPDLLAAVDPGAPGTGAAGRRAVTRLTQAPGAGAHGGAGFALALLGARLVPGPAHGAALVDLPGAVAGADLVVVVRPGLDHADLDATVLAQVVASAGVVGVPVVVLARTVPPLAGGLRGTGVAATYAPLPPQRRGAAGTVPGAAAAWEGLAARVARTWSPVPAHGA